MYPVCRQTVVIYANETTVRNVSQSSCLALANTDSWSFNIELCCSTSPFDLGFPGVVGTCLVWYNAEICRITGFKNSLPRSLCTKRGLPYLLYNRSSRALAICIGSFDISAMISAALVSEHLITSM